MGGDEFAPCCATIILHERSFGPVLPPRRRLSRRHIGLVLVAFNLDELEMKARYPASNVLEELSEDHIALKVARYSACSVCSDCSGLHPSSSVDLVRDIASFKSENSLTDLAGYGSDDEEEESGLDYLKTCACGHVFREHGALIDADSAEFQRRALIAVRLDALLEVRGHA